MPSLIYNTTSGVIALATDGTIASLADYVDDPENYTILTTDTLKSPHRYYVDVSQNPVVTVEKTNVPYTISATTVPADGSTNVVISGLPNDCLARLAEAGNANWLESTTITDNTLSINFDAAGTYYVRFLTAYNLETTQEITVT